jgi:hypothetical protein
VKRGLQVAFFAACGLFAAQQSEAATITINVPDASGRTFVDVVGEILPNDDKAFQQTTQQRTEYYAKKRHCHLVHPGGNAFAAMKIGELINTRRPAVNVEPSDLISVPALMRSTA